MAQGVDQWAAEICVELEIPFTAALPFRGQERLWRSKAARAYYHVLLQKAARVEVLSPGGYSLLKMTYRTCWMVDHCDLLVAVWDGSRGGTANCLLYAAEQKRKVHMIDPRKL